MLAVVGTNLGRCPRPPKGNRRDFLGLEALMDLFKGGLRLIWTSPKTLQGWKKTAHPWIPQEGGTWL